MSAPASLDHLKSWHSEWRGLKAVVLGSGRTGFSVADTLVELGVDVLVLASESNPERAELLRVIGAELITRDLADGSTKDVAAFGPDLVVTSPSFHPVHPLITWAHGASVPVWGDVELAWRVRDKVGVPAPWLAITGTNGKTNTAHLAEAMLLEEGRRAIACGNVGVPVLDAIRDPAGWDALVVELSSFQLHYLESMSAEASVCLNLAADHLEWHGSLESYSTDKAKVYRATRVGALYNRSDESTLTMVEDADVVEGCRAIGFGLGVPGHSDFGVVDGILCDRAFHDNRRDSAIELITVQELDSVGLASPQMVSNVLAGSALVRAIGVAPEVIHSAVLKFRVGPHNYGRADDDPSGTAT